jgi:hypothetical protein
MGRNPGFDGIRAGRQLSARGPRHERPKGATGGLQRIGPPLDRGSDSFDRHPLGTTLRDPLVKKRRRITQVDDPTSCRFDPRLR